MIKSLTDPKYIAETAAKPVVSGVIAGLLTRFVTYGVNPNTNASYKIEFAGKESSTLESISWLGPFYKFASLRNVFPFSKMAGQKYDLAIITGLSVTMASLVADVASDYVYSFITKDEMFDAPNSALFQTGAVSAGTLAGHYIVNDKAVGNRGMFNIVALASVSEVVGHMVYKNVLAPYIRGSDEMRYSF